MIINWRGLHGYGDFIPSFTFACNESVRLDEDMHIVFHFVNHTRKFKPADSSTFAEMIDYVHKNMDYTDVTRKITYEIRYGVPYFAIPEPQYSNGLDCMYAPHNFRMADKSIQWDGGEEGTIAVVSTHNHLQKFRDIKYRGQKVAGDKAWKDAWPDHWDLFCERFEDLGFKVNHVHYTDSVEEVVEKIRTSTMTYGYQAGAMWIARWIGAPMVTCTQNQQYAEWLMPWSVWYGPHQFDEVRYNYFDDYETSLERKRKYVANTELYKHARPGMHVRQAFGGKYRKRSFPYFSHSSQKIWSHFHEMEMRDVEAFKKELRENK